MFVADIVTSDQVERGTITFDEGVGAATVDVDPTLSVLRHDIEF